MIGKKELMERICSLEVMCSKHEEELCKLEKKVKKLEPKKERKSATNK